MSTRIHGGIFDAMNNQLVQVTFLNWLRFVKPFHLAPRKIQVPRRTGNAHGMPLWEYLTSSGRCDRHLQPELMQFF